MKYYQLDVNGDGYVDDEEKRMYMEFKRKELEDQDAMRDSQRKILGLHLEACCYILLLWLLPHSPT